MHSVKIPVRSSYLIQLSGKTQIWYVNRVITIESRSISFYLKEITCTWVYRYIDQFTSYYKTLWNDRNCGTQNWNCNKKYVYENYEIKNEELGTILKKLKNRKPSGEDNIPPEL